MQIIGTKVRMIGAKSNSDYNEQKVEVIRAKSDSEWAGSDSEWTKKWEWMNRKWIEQKVITNKRKMNRTKGN